MKFDILSDIHICNWQNALRGIDEFTIKFFIETYIKPKSENIIIAGDIGNKAENTLLFLKTLKNYYKNIMITFGNHDFYRTNQTEKLKFPTYQDKYNYYKQEIPKLGIILLDGNTTEIDGIVIGGSCGWYDFSHTRNRWSYLEDTVIYKNFVDTMTDSWAIYDIDRTKGLDILHIKKMIDETFQAEYKKLEAVHKNCDIMVSHISPINENFGIPVIYRNDMLTGAFSFDGMKLVKETYAQIYIYGHTHTKMDYEFAGKHFICNPLGYLGEENNEALLCEI